MVERANLTSRIPHWRDLDQTERYWAGYLVRLAEDREWVGEWRFGSHAFLLPESAFRFSANGWPPSTRHSAFLCESLLTALTHRDPMYAYRALLSAVENYAKLGPTSTFSDALTVAKSRVGKCFREALRVQRGS